MIDTKIFNRLRKSLEKSDRVREEIIVEARPVLKDAKKAIYALHNKEIKKARKVLDGCRSSLDSLNKKVHSSPESVSGAYHQAVQEYVEAETYYYFMTEQRLADEKELGADTQNYILGLCDLTGELSRKAVFSVVDEEYARVADIHEFVRTIHNELMQFSFRNSELRKKSDGIKWNIKRIEEILFELKVRDKI